MSDIPNKSISGGKKKREGVSTERCTGTGAPSSFSLVPYKLQPRTSVLQQQLPPSPVLAQKCLPRFVSALHTQHTALQEENQMAGTISAQTPKALRHLQIFKVFPPSNAKTALAEGYKHATITMLKESLKCKEFSNAF